MTGLSREQRFAGSSRGGQVTKAREAANKAEGMAFARGWAAAMRHVRATSGDAE